MLGLVPAASNAPSMYRPRKDWKAIYKSQTTLGIPPPTDLAKETDESVDQYIGRIQKGFDTLRGQLQRYRPDILVVLGYDDGTCFSGVQVPQLCTYTGPEIAGTTALAALGEKPGDHLVKLPCLPEFAWELHTGLLDRSFDIGYMQIQSSDTDWQRYLHSGVTQAKIRAMSLLAKVPPGLKLWTQPWTTKTTEV